MSRASAKRVITRITHERRQLAQRDARNAKRRAVYRLTRERERRPGGGISRKPKPPPPDEPIEYAVSADYKSRRGRAVSVQLSIFADTPATKGELKSAIHDKLTTGNDPQSFRIRIVDWRGRQAGSPVQQDKDWRAFTPALFSSRLHIRKDREN